MKTFPSPTRHASWRVRDGALIEEAPHKPPEPADSDFATHGEESDAMHTAEGEASAGDATDPTVDEKPSTSRKRGRRKASAPDTEQTE